MPVELRGAPMEAPSIRPMKPQQVIWRGAQTSPGPIWGVACPERMHAGFWAWPTPPHLCGAQVVHPYAKENAKAVAAAESYNKHLSFVMFQHGLPEEAFNLRALKPSRELIGQGGSATVYGSSDHDVSAESCSEYGMLSICLPAVRVLSFSIHT